MGFDVIDGEGTDKPVETAATMTDIVQGCLLTEKEKETIEYFQKFTKIFKELANQYYEKNLSRGQIVWRIQQMRRHFDKFDKACQERNRHLNDYVSWFEKRFWDENDIEPQLRRMPEPPPLKKMP